MNIVNLTPHKLNIKKQDGSWLNIPASGTVARVSQESNSVGAVDGLTVSHHSFGEVTGLPEGEDDTIYIVSALVLARVPRREDVFGTGKAIRNEKGQIIGCEGLSASEAYSKLQPVTLKYQEYLEWYSGGIQTFTPEMEYLAYADNNGWRVHATLNGVLTGWSVTVPSRLVEGVV